MSYSDEAKTRTYPEAISANPPNSDSGQGSLADEVLNALESAAHRARRTATRTNEKLTPVMIHVPPRDVCDKDAPEFPPLFATIRLFIIEINEALDTIEDCIDRTAL